MLTQSQVRFGKELNKVTISDVKSLIQNEIEESQNLDYNQPSANLKNDCNGLAAIISGFLNTDGGILIYGVSEKEEKKHKLPADIIWCDTTKERLESLLKSRITPWNEKIQILRIRKEKTQKSIFVIEIPRSLNPPHMHNYRYYQRLNYQTIPMSHWNISRVFQTSWIRRKELHQNIIEPIYSEIKLTLERLEKYEQGSTGRYRHITTTDIYLYERIEPSIRKLIDGFYDRILILNKNLAWSNKIAQAIINKQLLQVFPENRDYIEERYREDHLYLDVQTLDPSSRLQVMNPDLNRALVLRKAPKSYLQSLWKHYQIIKFEPILRTTVKKKIPVDTFNQIWENCERVASKNETLLLIWNEVPKLLKLGKKIIGFLSEN